MRISGLFNKHPGSDIYIVGTGPTARLLPRNFFDKRICIGLNQAYKLFKLTYTITVHPELEVEYRDIMSRHPKTTNKTQWIVKRKPPTVLSFDDATRYVFSTSYDWKDFICKESDILFLGRGVQQTAIDMAARMGAKTIILVGVDMASVGGDHHSHDQHVQFHSVPANDVYKEYRLWTYKARKLARDKANINVLSLSPLLGCGGDVHEQDYAQYLKELGLSKLPEPEDVSKYDRKGIDLP